MRFTGRVLYLVNDPELVRWQLAGERLGPEVALAELRDDISTDEIIPARHCLEVGPALGAHCYVGMRCGNIMPIESGAVRDGGFAVSVAGIRRGKGSSREQAPYAEMQAGIRLVFARSFERIYRQNCHNLGLMTSTDFSLLSRIEAGDEIAFDELCVGLDPLSREILAAGGLFQYSRMRPPSRSTASESDTVGPFTLAEKILAQHATGTVTTRGVNQFFRCDLRYSHEYVTPMAAALLRERAPDAELLAPESIVMFEDHLSAIALAPGVDSATVFKADRLAQAQINFVRGRGLRMHGRDGDFSEGICHALVVESYALPGQLVVGSDSHTCHVGALGCVAVGVGASDIANAWISGQVLLPMPRQVLVRLDAQLPSGVTEKDLMLHLLALPQIRQGQAIGAVVEFAGDGIRALDVDARCTLTNMTAEMGAVTGIVAPDQQTARHLVLTRGMEEEKAQALCSGLKSDNGANYDLVVDVVAEGLEPLIALPNDPANAVGLTSLTDDVPITRAYGGSCTAAKRRDMDMYATVIADALAAGRRVHPNVEFYIQVGSKSVMSYCIEKGYIDLFTAAGISVLGPSCGACINAGPGSSTAATDVTVSAQNRNFPGRSGPGAVYLASPLTVAASAIEGRLCGFIPAAAVPSTEIPSV